MSQPVTESVSLESPIQRDGGDIDTIAVRKPAAGELRGTSLTNLLQMDYAALEAVLPRITMPTLSKADIQVMDPGDFTMLANTVVGFLLPKSMQDNA